MVDMSGFASGISTLVFAAIAVPFIIVALVFVGWVLRNRRRADQSGSWNKTTARIVQSQVEARQSHDEHGYHTAYYPVVIYEYAINSQRYQNDRINFGPDIGYGTTGPSEMVVGRYHVGNVVDVYFDPTNPAESVLERTAGSGNNILLFVGALIVVVLLCAGVTMFGVMSMTNHFVSGITSEVSGITSQVNGILTQTPK